MSDEKNTNDALHISEMPHNALSEFSRDERRPAVLLLSALVIAAIFFALGIMVGRWTSDSANATKTIPVLNSAPIKTTSPENLGSSPPVQPSPQISMTPQTSPTPKPSSTPLSH